ncbi:hypothetical protein PVT68_15375 [Microbulbifer bruguierae]|uniref:Uncharacterized protein n=1 Tax=Microbulbifer bruguierae TaxID=3029061 RepID=A0ABY8NB42_9GAMM|nr:hypothetical protein [Microbulbifer bruguierae]WGL16141.1 hypothetical protein PVT68_15375 [Microbulbifer bruguierae]
MSLHRLFQSNFRVKTPLLIFAVSVCLPSAAIAKVSSVWPGYNGSDAATWLAVTPVEIQIEAPTPLSGNNLQLLLALSADGGLGELRKKANEEFSDYLNQQVQKRFGDFFTDERVHLVDEGAPLTLSTNFQITIRQKIVNVVNRKNYDLEEGTMTAYGTFHYRLEGTAAGAQALREGTVDISDLGLEAGYRNRIPKDAGIVEDTTREASERLLAEIAEEVLDEIENKLNADSLLALARI